MSPQCAAIRRIQMVFGIFNLIPLGIIWMLGVRDTVILVGLWVNVAMLLWLVIDGVVTLRLVRSAGLLSTTEPGVRFTEKDILTFTSLFFKEGVTWKYLESLIRKEEEKYLEAERARRERDERIKVLAEEKVVEERERREARRGREAAELLQKGIALGIPEGDMQLRLAEGLAHARALIVKKEHEKELLERASAASCRSVIETLLQQGEFDKAERYIAEAKKRRELVVLQAGFLARIEKLPRARQPEAHGMLSKLVNGGMAHGTREFRIAEHELHKYLAR